MGKRLSATYLLCFFALCANAQTRHDANWCFGYGAGLHFNSNNTKQIFFCNTKNSEACASFSSIDGNLLFYTIVEFRTDSNVRIETPPSRPTIINGDSIFLGHTITSGGTFIPEVDDSIVHFVHLGYDIDSAAAGTYTIDLYRTSILLKSDTAKVLLKNDRLIKGPLQEKLAITKTYEPGCWWVVAHRNNIVGSCTNEFITLKVCDGIITDSIVMNIGSLFCSPSNLFGEMEFSEDGSLLVCTWPGEAKAEVFKFNRCTGLLSEERIISGFRDIVTGSIVYGAVFSGMNIYFSEPQAFDKISTIYQYNLSDSILSPIYTFDSTQNDPWAMEMGPDGKIYVSHCGFGCSFGNTNNSTQCLSVIHNPDQPGLACNFEPFGFCFPDSIKMNSGLPNFPNYDLPPTPVFTANAGKDTTVCASDSISVLLGSMPVPNIIYSWQPATGLSATNTAQPIANPAQSTWYYLTATDTTATSCAVNTDSVYVEVRTCVGITETANLQAKLYPNPTTGTVTVELPSAIGGMFTLFNLLGQRVLEAPLTSKSTVLDIDASPGIYLYQIFIDRHLQNGKLLVE